MLLAVIIPSVACFACAARIAIWLRRSRAAVSEDEALRRPGGIVRLAAVLGLVFTGWSLSPYPYGNAYAQFHFAF
nr:hypothetical protein [uncultured Lichenicoccus sp.]